MENINEAAKKEYDAFLESGDLKILYPNMKGDWEKDKVRWIPIWKEIQNVINVSTKNFNNNK